MYYSDCLRFFKQRRSIQKKTVWTKPPQDLKVENIQLLAVILNNGPSFPDKVLAGPFWLTRIHWAVSLVEAGLWKTCTPMARAYVKLLGATLSLSSKIEFSQLSYLIWWSRFSENENVLKGQRSFLYSIDQIKAQSKIQREAVKSNSCWDSLWGCRDRTKCWKAGLRPFIMDKVINIDSPWISCGQPPLTPWPHQASTRVLRMHLSIPKILGYFTPVRDLKTTSSKLSWGWLQPP